MERLIAIVRRKDNRADWARLPCHAVCRYRHHVLGLFDERSLVVETNARVAVRAGKRNGVGGP